MEGDCINLSSYDGKGKEYNSKNELIFDGEYQKGKRWNGKGKECDSKDELIFDGEYVNGEKKSI